jgi:hypothetical protein
VNLEQFIQVRHGEKPLNGRGNAAQLDVTGYFACTGEQPHHHPQSTAVNENDVGQVQDKKALLAHPSADLGTEALHLLTRDDAAGALYDRHIPNCAGIQSKRHKGSPRVPLKTRDIIAPESSEADRANDAHCWSEYL